MLLIYKITDNVNRLIYNHSRAHGSLIAIYCNPRDRARLTMVTK